MTSPTTTSNERCKMIYKNLLTTFGRFSIHNKYNDSKCIGYIRELQETARCDHMHDMAPYRDKLRTEINKGDPNRHNRILSYKDTQDDNKIVLQTLHNYGDIIDKELLKGLDFSSRLTYRFNYGLDWTEHKYKYMSASIKEWLKV